MFLIPEERSDLRDQADELPRAHGALRRPLRSYRELPLRYAEAAPLHRNELAGTLHGLTRVRHVTQDDAHIFCTREQIEDEIFGCLDYAKFALRPLRPRVELRALDPAREQARHRRGVGLHRGRAPRGARAARARRTSLNEGDGAFYGPKIDLHMTRLARPRRGRWAPIQLDTQHAGSASASATSAPTTPSTPRTSSTARCFGSFERFIGILIEHYAGAFPFWLAPVQVRVLPVGEGHRERRAGARRQARPLPGRGRRLRRHRRQADPERRGREDPVRRRLRRQGVRRGARDPRARRGAETLSLARFPGETCYPESLASRGGTVSHLLAHASEVQPRLNRAVDREPLPLHASGFFVLQRRSTRAW